MSTITTLVLFGEVSVASLLGNGIVLGALLGGALRGWRTGLLTTTLLGFAVTVSFIVAFATAKLVSDVLIHFDLSADHASWVAYVAMLAITLFGCHSAIETYAEEPMWFPDGLVARSASAACGCATGVVLAGSILVGWSTIPLPPVLQVSPKDLTFDAGAYSLGLFAKCIERDQDVREKLLGGCSELEEKFWPCASEPFADTNGNCERDDEERFYDWDENGEFTKELRCTTRTGPDGKDFGWLDNYLLASWKDPKTLHKPELKSERVIVRNTEEVAGGIFYQAVAEDADPCDQLEYSLTVGSDTPADAVVIDKSTGMVTLTEAAIQNLEPQYHFTVTVADRSGLKAEQSVQVKVKHKQDRENDADR